MPVIRWREHIENASFALMLFVSVLVYSIAADHGLLPDLTHIIAWLDTLFQTYGYWALALGAFIEAIFMVSLYLPGSMVIMAAILFSDRTFSSLAEIMTLCWLSFMAASFINYAMGYYGFYRIFNSIGAQRMLDNTAEWMKKYGHWAYLMTSFHPNYIAIVEVCAGMSRLGILKNTLLAGSAMMISGPILTFISANVIDAVVTPNGNDNLTLMFVASFGLWALFIVGKGIYTDLKGKIHAHTP